jgi:hypothetical protein
MRAGHSDNIHTRSNPSPSTNTHQPNNYGSNSQDPLGEQRDHRVLSVSRPLITTQDPHLDGNNSVSGALEHLNGIGSGSSEISDMSSELILGSGTTSGLGYDGTQPIAYIIVPDPQLYLPRLANDAPAPHRQEISVSKGHPNTETSDQTHSRRDDKALPLGKTVHNPGVTPHTTQIEVFNQVPIAFVIARFLTEPNSSLMLRTRAYTTTRTLNLCLLKQTWTIGKLFQINPRIIPQMPVPIR